MSPGSEWAPRMPGWSVIHVRDGDAYWLSTRLNKELAPGSILVLARQTEGAIRASHLSTVSLHFFRVDIKRLTGLITLSEQHFFETAAAPKEPFGRFFAPTTQQATGFSELLVHRGWDSLPFRVQLLQFFVQLFRTELPQGSRGVNGPPDTKERLRRFLEQTSASELLGLSARELAERTLCTPRHLSRVFHEVGGMSFRDRKTELRMVRARELLAASQMKVLDVALESGYQSVSLFNLMFKNRFGVTPGQWRIKDRTSNSLKNRVRCLPAERRPGKSSIELRILRAVDDAENPVPP